MILRLKQYITTKTIAGWFSIMGIITVSWIWQVGIVLVALATIFWWNPSRKNHS